MQTFLPPGDEAGMHRVCALSSSSYNVCYVVIIIMRNMQYLTLYIPACSLYEC